jgi:hypothetical protein
MITFFGSANGSISTSANGGTPTYTYSIDGVNFYTQSTVSSLSAGNYTITAKDANGCTQTFSTTITEPKQVAVSGESKISNTRVSNGSSTLTVSGGLTTYAYSINGTNYYSGSLFSTLAAGTYTCYVKDANGCISSTTIVVEETAGINENELQLINLYPNPNNGVFELEIDGLTGDKVNCKLFNIQGQLVSEFSLTATDGKVKKTIEMSKKLASGTYYLGIYNENKAVVKQFIKE